MVLVLVLALTLAEEREERDIEVGPIPMPVPTTIFCITPPTGLTAAGAAAGIAAGAAAGIAALLRLPAFAAVFARLLECVPTDEAEDNSSEAE